MVPALSPPLEDPADDDVLPALLLLAPASPLPPLPLLPLAALSLAPLLAPSLLVASCGLDLPEFEPLRKSVTYQPEPFNWNPAAVSCFLNFASPQAGQSVRGASETFCSASFAKPQASQR